MEKSSLADTTEHPTAEIEDRVIVSEDARYTEDDIQNITIMNTMTGDFYGLDDSAVIIWKALVLSKSINKAVDALVNAYGVETKVAVDDVLVFVRELAANGLVSVVRSE